MNCLDVNPQIIKIYLNNFFFSFFLKVQSGWNESNRLEIYFLTLAFVFQSS